MFEKNKNKLKEAGVGQIFYFRLKHFFYFQVSTIEGRDLSPDREDEQRFEGPDRRDQLWLQEEGLRDEEGQAGARVPDEEGEAALS